MSTLEFMLYLAEGWRVPQVAVEWGYAGCCKSSQWSCSHANTMNIAETNMEAFSCYAETKVREVKIRRREQARVIL